MASAAQKDISSTAGMQATVRTSGLFRARVDTLVPERMVEIEAAIHARDFPTFARITMRESNSFHATCLDTDPPIFYLTDVSRAAIQAVQAINHDAGRLIAAYTFDAGPNAVVYYEEGERERVLGGFRSAVGGKEGWEEEEGKEGGKGKEGWGEEEEEGEKNTKATSSPPEILTPTPPPFLQILRTGIQRIIHTSVGDGPVSVHEHLD